MTFTTSRIISKVHKARKEEYSGGLAHLLVRDLLKEHQPKVRTSKVEAKVKSLEIKMELCGDPKHIFEQTSKVENECNDESSSLDKEDLISVVLDAIEKEHKSVLTSEMRQKDDAVTLDNLKEAMDEHHRLISQTTGHAETKLGLGATCYNCGEKGHMKKN